MKKILLTMWVMAIGMVWAMPTTEEIRKAQPLVAELMADDVAAFERGDKTAVEVGNAALEYAGKAETEVAKFVLYKGALQYFVRGKEYDKAAKAVESLRGAVKDIPPEEVVDLIRVAAKGVRGKDAPRLLAVLKEAQQQVQARKGVATAKRVLKVRPADAEARRALAEWFAVGGDWDAALEAFAVCGGKEKQFAEAEAEEKNLVAVADFWWAYEPKVVPSDDVFKAHAAGIYRSCIADGTLTGLKKEVVEKRLKPAESVVVEKPKVATPSNTVPLSDEKTTGLYLCIDLSNGPDAEAYKVSYFDEVPAGGWTDEFRRNKLVLRRIEHGTFKMGEKYHVQLTRDYYIGIFEVTSEQFFKVTGLRPASGTWDNRYAVDRVSYAMIRGGQKGAKWPASADVDMSSFIGKLRARTSLDFDLPTESQWEYACRAGTKSDYWWGDQIDGSCLHWQKNAGWFTRIVGVKRPNSWGLYDMLGNVGELCLDWKGNLASGRDPRGRPSGRERVVRGGSSISAAHDCKVGSRAGLAPDDKNSHVGFRICYTPNVK